MGQSSNRGSNIPHYLTIGRYMGHMILDIYNDQKDFPHILHILFGCIGAHVFFLLNHDDDKENLQEQWKNHIYINNYQLFLTNYWSMYGYHYIWAQVLQNPRYSLGYGYRLSIFVQIYLTIGPLLSMGSFCVFIVSKSHLYLLELEMFLFDLKAITLFHPSICEVNGMMGERMGWMMLVFSHLSIDWF